MSQKTFTIGELARRSGLSTRKIRFYADDGLLSPGRTGTGYRVFDDRDLVVLDLIRPCVRRARALIPFAPS